MAKSFKQMAKSLQTFFTKEVKAAGVTSINRAIASTKSQAVKQVAEATGGKQKDLRTRIGAFKATAKRPSGAMISFAKPISLSAFNPKTKQVSSGRGKRVGATVTGPSGRYLVPQAVMVKYPSGKSNVFTRLPSGDIKNLYTNALITYMSRPEVAKGLQNKAKQEFEKNFEHEVKRRKLED